MLFLTPFRLSGLGLLVGGLLGMLANSMHSEEMIHHNGQSSHVLLYFAVMLVLLGLPGLWARQAQQARIPGLIGFLMVFFGLPFADLLHSVLSFSVIPALSANPNTASLVADGWESAFMEEVFSGPLGLMQNLAVPLLFLGLVIFGIGTLRARVLPRWTGWVLIASPFLLAASFSLPFSQGRGPAVLYLMLATCGYALLMNNEAVAHKTSRAEPATGPSIAVSDS